MGGGSVNTRVWARISGVVQGVAFRYYTRREATSLGLSGWVKNLPDGSVELVAEGEESLLKTFLDWCHHGPAMAVVKEVESDWMEASGEFTHFEIRR